MSLLLHAGPLLAQTSRVDEMARHMAEGFRGEPVRFEGGVWWIVVLILAGLLAAAWVLGGRVGRSQGRAMRSSPRRLFVGLCRAHGLTRDDRRLLWRLARVQGLENPGQLFLEPERFDRVAPDPELQNGHSRYQAIRRRLFAGLEVNTSR